MSNQSLRPGPEAKAAVDRALLRSQAEGRSPRILFVCLGNICRSPAAHGILEKMAAQKGLDLEVDSAGFYRGHAGELPDRRMREAARQRGYILDHRARPITRSDLDEFDLVVGMDDYNIRDLHNLALTDAQDSRIVRMTDFAAAHPHQYSVPDPYYEGTAGFQLVLDILEDACSTLLQQLEDAKNC